MTSANIKKVFSKILEFPVVTSTNDVAKRLIKESDVENLVIISKTQTNGRGRDRKIFYSPKDVGAYFSILLRNVNTDLNSISKMSAIAIIRAINTFVSADIKIKTPNDLLINGKKICGVLIESSFDLKKKVYDYLIIGIGINVNNNLANLCPDIQGIATSIKEETGIIIPIKKLIEEVLYQFIDLMGKSNNFIEDEYFMKLL